MLYGFIKTRKQCLYKNLEIYLSWKKWSRKKQLQGRKNTENSMLKKKLFNEQQQICSGTNWEQVLSCRTAVIVWGMNQLEDTSLWFIPCGLCISTLDGESLRLSNKNSWLVFKSCISRQQMLPTALLAYFKVN